MKDLTIKEAIKHVAKFHNSFGIENKEVPTAVIGEDQFMLRHRLMQEENNEYLAEIADALGDQLYILCGTILKHGMQDVITEVFEEIQRSNMSKLDTDGNPIYRADGKVLKGENYFKPDIQSILEK